MTEKISNAQVVNMSRENEQPFLTNEFIEHLLKKTNVLNTLNTPNYRLARNQFIKEIFLKLCRLNTCDTPLDKLSELTINITSPGYAKHQLKYDMSCELITTIDNCLKNFSPEKGIFAHYLNHSLKTCKLDRLEEISEEVKQPIVLPPAILNIITKMQRYMTENRLQTLTDEQLCEFRKSEYHDSEKGPSESKLRLAYKFLNTTYVSVLTNDEGEDPINIPIVDENFQDDDKIYLEYYEKFSGLIQTMSAKKADTCRAVSTNLFYGAWWWTFSKERKTYHKDFAEQHDVLHQDVYVRCEEVPRETKRNDAGWLKASSVAKIIGKDNAVITNMTKEIGVYLESNKD